MKISDFKKDFSSSAFKIIDNNRRIVGKWCEIEALTSDDECLDVFDIWIVRPNRESISNQKLTWIIKGINSLPSYSPEELGTIQVLDGEAYLQTSDRALVLEVAFLCGVRKRMHYSETTLQKKRKQLAKIRGAA
jgi:hypothetical protein